MATKTKPLLGIVPAPSASVEHNGPQKSGEDARTPVMVAVEVKKKSRVVKEDPEAEPPSMKLGGIGHHRKPLLTAAQLHELQLQGLIFKYIAAGLPVPPGLMLPTWKSVRNVSFVQCSPWGLDMMDPEPWRCKRTDGKKWRCGKSVVPDQKYCERHMHRGRKCSRKLVEASQTATAGDTTPFNDGSRNLEKSNTKVCSVDPSSLRLENLSSDNTNISHKMPTINSSTFNVKILGMSSGQNNASLTMIAGAFAGERNTAAANITNAIHKETTTAKAIIKNNSNGSKISINSHEMHDGNCNCLNSAQSKTIIDKTRRSDNKNVATDTGLDFSPKSVLPVQPCRDPRFHRNDPKLEPGRCRRTDGRKWRCRRDVLPDQKYCATHMHRGAKKHVKASQPSVSPTSTPNVSCDTRGHPNVSHGRVHIVNANEKFSISTRTSPGFIVNDDTSTSSMSSDNTISDPMVVSSETGNTCTYLS